MTHAVGYSWITGCDLAADAEIVARLGVVEPADQPGDLDTSGFRRTVLPVVVGHLALYERQDLAFSFVDAE